MPLVGRDVFDAPVRALMVDLPKQPILTDLTADDTPSSPNERALPITGDGLRRWELEQESAKLLGSGAVEESPNLWEIERDVMVE